MRRDIRTGFPFDEVLRKDYRNVDRELRAVWRVLRIKARAYGFGWNTLEPIKTEARIAAKYLAKYLSKAQMSHFRVGEERARLFGIWGRKRFVFQRFSWVSNRIFRQRLAWYASDAGLEDVTDTTRLLGRNWWLKLGPELLDVIMPEKYYQVWNRESATYQWDQLGLRAYRDNLNKYGGDTEDRVKQSRFAFYCADGKAMGYSTRDASRYAQKKVDKEFGPQRQLILRSDRMPPRIE